MRRDDPDWDAWSADQEAQAEAQRERDHQATAEREGGRL